MSKTLQERYIEALMALPGVKAAGVEQFVRPAVSSGKWEFRVWIRTAGVEHGARGMGIYAEDALSEAWSKLTRFLAELGFGRAEDVRPRSTSIRTCGTCAHFKPWTASHLGDCKAPLPICATDRVRENFAPARAGCLGCPCWTEK